MARLQIDWSSQNGLNFANESRDNWSKDLSADEAKPTLFYLTTDKARAKSKMNLLENTVLMDERVATAAKFFNCRKIDGDTLDSDHPLFSELKGRQLPRMVVVSAEGKKVSAVEGKVSATRLYGAMKKSAEREFVVKLDKLVKHHRQLLNDLDKLNGRRTVLASKEERADGRETGDIRKLRREIELTELKLEDVERKLFDVKRRSAS